MTYTVTSEAETTAYLFATISKRASEGLYGEWFTITVNGSAVTIPERTVEGIGFGEEEWHTFISVKVAPVTLRKGQNTIVFTTGNESTNFDCFDLYSTVKLS